jgi:two-component system LytT family sensor kinase
VADGVLAPAVVSAAVVLGLAVMVWAARGRRAFGTVEERATYAALHQASLAAPALRTGLNTSSATTSARHLRALLASPP